MTATIPDDITDLRSLGHRIIHAIEHLDGFSSDGSGGPLDDSEYDLSLNTPIGPVTVLLKYAHVFVDDDSPEGYSCAEDCPAAENHKDAPPKSCGCSTTYAITDGAVEIHPCAQHK